MSDESVRDTGVAKIDEAVSVLAGIAAVTPPSDTYGGSLPARMAEAAGSETVVTTLAALKTACAAGGRIRISGTIDVTSETNLTLTKDGTANSPNTITGGKLIGGIIIASSFWRIRGVEITGAAADGIRLVKSGGTYFIEVDGCWIHHVGAHGISTVYDNASDIQLWNNLVEQCGQGFPTTSAAYHCINTVGVNSKWTVANNLLYPRNGFGIHLPAPTNNATLVANTVVGGVSRGGFAVKGATNVVIVGAVVANSPSGAFEITAASAPTTTIRDSVQWNNVHGQWATGFSAAGTVTNLVAANPLLTSDHHLQAGSPCVSLVQASRYPFLPALDKAGAARVTADAGCFRA